MVAKKNDQAALQQAYMQLQLIEQQLKGVEEQVVEIETKKQELAVLKEGLSELGKTKKNSASFSPIGMGIYAKSTVLDTKKLLVNIGSNIFMEKTVEEISKNLDTQVKKFNQLSQQLTQNYQILAAQSQALQHQLHESVQER